MKKHQFSAKIYQTGINWCVDVPIEITKSLVAEKGRIPIKGKINGFVFTKTLVPVKDSPHGLFVNRTMMKGGNTALGKMATFEIEQDDNKEVKEYPVPELLAERLIALNLMTDFDNLTASRRREILKYFSYIKTEETFIKNRDKLITQLKNKEKNVRIP